MQDTDAAPIGNGILRIPVPITDNPLGHTLVYGVESPGGLILVDAGWDDENAWEGLTSGLRAVGHSITDVEGVVLTHFHPDHTGLCGRIREESGAWIAMHEADIPMFEQMVEPRDENWLAGELKNLARAGASAKELAAFEAAPHDPPTTARSAPDRVLVDGQEIPLAGRSLRTVFTPGHSPGHVCFQLVDNDIMFTGDHVLQKTTPHVGSFIFPLEKHDVLAEFIESLQRVGTSTGIRGLGSHGLPIDCVAGRAGELIEHHEERLSDMVDAFGEDHLTLWQVTKRMTWYKPWKEMSPMGRMLALSEASAHLRHLVACCDVARVGGSDPAVFVRVC